MAVETGGECESQDAAEKWTWVRTAEITSSTVTVEQHSSAAAAAATMVLSALHDSSLRQWIIQQSLVHQLRIRYSHSRLSHPIWPQFNWPDCAVIHCSYTKLSYAVKIPSLLWLRPFTVDWARMRDDMNYMNFLRYLSQVSADRCSVLFVAMHILT